MNQEISDDTTELENVLAGLEDSIKEIQVELEKFKGVTETFQQKKLPFLSELSNIEKQDRSVKISLDKLENEQHNLTQKEREVRKEENQIKFSQAEKKRVKEELLKDMEEHRNHLQQEKAKALEYCPAVEVSDQETTEKLVTEIKDLTKQLKNETEKKNCTRQEAYTKYKEAKEKLDDITDKRDKMNKFRIQLNETLNNRYVKWQKLIRRIALRTCHYFNNFLTRKGYSGELVFIHQENNTGKLDVHVQLNKNKQGIESKGDTKSLSGGERSFSTVSLLLALWEAMECPFRAMDEFDVFMDEVNRRISIDLLLSQASENLSKQYIFVTPLSLSSIQPGPFICVHKVGPPVRGQQTIIESSQHN